MVASCNELEAITVSLEAHQDFRYRFCETLYRQLIPQFCDDAARRCDVSTFNKSSVNLSEQDAANFLRALDNGLIHHVGRGLYRAVRSAASEQFFWTGRNVPGLRSFSLWLEPIITVGALARLHFDYGWPEDLIGTQSVDWAFDLVGFLPGACSEHIAGEVKKTNAELDQLLMLMFEFGQLPVPEAPPPSGKARNAYKKIAALRERRAPIFWAIGPDGTSKVHRVEYHAGDRVKLVKAEAAIMQFSSHS